MTLAAVTPRGDRCVRNTAGRDPARFTEYVKGLKNADFASAETWPGVPSRSCMERSSQVPRVIVQSSPPISHSALFPHLKIFTRIFCMKIVLVALDLGNRNSKSAGAARSIVGSTLTFPVFCSRITFVSFILLLLKFPAFLTTFAHPKPPANNLTTIPSFGPGVPLPHHQQLRQYHQRGRRQGRVSSHSNLSSPSSNSPRVAFGRLLPCQIGEVVAKVVSRILSRSNRSSPPSNSPRVAFRHLLPSQLDVSGHPGRYFPQ